MIYPKVKSIVYGDSITHQGNTLDYTTLDFFYQKIFVERGIPSGKGSVPIVLQQVLSLRKEEYKITYNIEKCLIQYCDEASKLYAIYTLIQMAKDHFENEFVIHDYPDLAVRGFMLDISRNKIPKMEEIKRIIKHLSFLKLNHFELYIEGFSFYDESYPSAKYQDSLTKEEFKELQSFATDYAVDLVPNMNGLGHMSSWLSLPKYRSLAEKEDGFIEWGHPFPPSTIDPSDERSFPFVQGLYKPLLEISTSKYFNMNLDEPFELGRGKNKDLSEKIGKGQLYLDWAIKLKNHVQSYGLHPLMWADVIFQHPELISSLPKDVIYCDWGYDKGYPFETHAKIFEEEGLDYLLCPGTSSWNSFTSRYEDMYQTIKDASQAAKDHHGLGVLLTDWGDFGHLQPIIFSYLGLIYQSLFTWGNENEIDVIEVLNQEFIHHRQLSMSIYDLSRYSLFENEYIYNGTMLFQTLMYSDPDLSHPISVRTEILLRALESKKLTKQSFDNIKHYFLQIEKQIPNLPGIETQEISTMLQLLKLMNEIRYRLSWGIKLETDYHIEIDQVILRLKEIWLKRNRKSYLDDSILRLKSLKEMLKYQSGL